VSEALTPFGRYIEANGVTCCVCRRRCAEDGVAPGDDLLYCGPCWRSGRRPEDQLELFGTEQAVS
jgi:hypothetical protein